MLYDTIYRHNQALAPDALTTVSTAVHAVTAALDDCRRAGKSPAEDAAVLLLVRHLADLAVGQPLDLETLRSRCRADREEVLRCPALLRLAGHSLGGEAAAKRSFHHQARQALARLAEHLSLNEGSVRITTTLGMLHEDGTTELTHADVGLRVVPRGFLPDSEVSIFRCEQGRPVGRVRHAAIATLLDPLAFATQWRSLLPAPAPAPILRVAA